MITYNCQNDSWEGLGISIEEVPVDDPDRQFQTFDEFAEHYLKDDYHKIRIKTMQALNGIQYLYKEMIPGVVDYVCKVNNFTKNEVIERLITNVIYDALQK